MTAIFLDTVGLVAMWNRADQWHDTAIAAFELILNQNATRSLRLATFCLSVEIPPPAEPIGSNPTY